MIRNFVTQKNFVLTTILMLLISIPEVGALADPVSSNPGSRLELQKGTHDLVLGTKKKKKKRSRRTTTRRYTLRGNPDVTRKVATGLIAEKLPELARLVGIDLPETPENVVQVEESEDPTASIATASHQAVLPASSKVSPGNGYDDSEFSEEEDPDQLNAEDEEQLYDVDDLTIQDFYKEFTDYMAALNDEVYFTYNGIDIELAMEGLMEWLGTRYLFGGTTKNGIDCSAFTRTMYRNLGYQLPRTAAAQWDASNEKIEYEELQFGDLVFFHTRKAVYVSHVGMYLGNGMFAHASSRNGVTVSSLESSYYSSHFIGARRYDVAGALADAEEKKEIASISE